MSDIASRSWHGAARGRVPDRGTGFWLRLGLGGALLCGAIAAAVKAVASLPSAPSSTAVPAPVEHWIPIVKPVRVYGFEAPELRAVPLAYLARRHAVDGGREDTLVIGSFGEATPLLRFSLFRRAREPADVASLAVALARQASDAGLIDAGLATGSMLRPERLATRFGQVEVADLALSSGPASNPAGAKAPGPTKAGVRTCSGFHLALERPAFIIAGLACGADGKPMTRRALGCLIERLDLASARDDRELIDFFAASELRRDAGCAGMGLGPDAAHAAWLDDKLSTPRGSSRRR